MCANVWRMVFNNPFGKLKSAYSTEVAYRFNLKSIEGVRKLGGGGLHVV